MSAAGPDVPLFFALREYAEAREEAFVRARRHLRMSDLDARALLYICRNPGTRPKPLAEHLVVTGAAVTTLIDRLTARGLIERRADDAARGPVHVVATKQAEDGPVAELCDFDDRIRAALPDEPLPERSAAAAMIRRLLVRE